jgi:hypothetical protein
MRNRVNFLSGHQEFVKNTKLPFETGRVLIGKKRAKRLKFTDLVDKLLGILN